MAFNVHITLICRTAVHNISKNRSILSQSVMSLMHEVLLGWTIQYYQDFD